MLRSFRGKNAETGEWVKGWLVVRRERPGDPKYFIIKDDGNGNQFEEPTPVIRATVSQTTGVHDRAHRMIYEGDIVCYASGYLGAVRFKNGTYFTSRTDMLTNTKVAQNRVRVVGNVYDNLETLLVLDAAQDHDYDDEFIGELALVRYDNRDMVEVSMPEMIEVTMLRIAMSAQIRVSGVGEADISYHTRVTPADQSQFVNSLIEYMGTKEMQEDNGNIVEDISED